MTVCQDKMFLQILIRYWFPILIEKSVYKLIFVFKHIHKITQKIQNGGKADFKSCIEIRLSHSWICPPIDSMRSQSDSWGQSSKPEWQVKCINKRRVHSGDFPAERNNSVKTDLYQSLTSSRKKIYENRWNIKLNASEEDKYHCFYSISPFWYSSFLHGFHLLHGCSSLTLSLSLWISLIIIITLPVLWSSKFLLSGHRSAWLSKAMVITDKGPGGWSERNETGWKVGHLPRK